MRTQQLLQWIDPANTRARTLIALVLAACIASVPLLVYHTGGIKYVYSHSMYIPILLAGLIFGTQGGVLAGLLGGLALGPAIPISVETGEAQAAINWLYRTGFFTLIGFLSGIASNGARAHLQRITWLSRHDPATGLPNRMALIDRLDNPKASDSPYCLAVIELENAVELKSAFGHPLIDTAIRTLAGRLSVIIAGSEAYRVETAQLALLVPRCHYDPQQAIRELTEACHEPVLHNDIPIHIDTRIGHLHFDTVTELPETYLQWAEAALIVARNTAQDNQAYSPAIHTGTEDNLGILGELKQAMQDRQLSLHYQPKIHMQSGETGGSEALIRWQHPIRGNIPPGIFIPRAEQSSLIQKVTEFALDQAIAQAVAWQQAGMSVPVAVNIAPQNLLHPAFTDTVLALLERHRLDGTQLELEVTERGLMVDMEGAISALKHLSDAGLTVSIDDFGTGYCSLQYLHRLPASLIKIDQSFIRRLSDDPDATHIVDATISLAHRLGMQVLAEGVETIAIYDRLRDMGCDIAQGYLMGRPMPASDFAHWYRKGNGCYSHA